MNTHFIGCPDCQCDQCEKNNERQAQRVLLERAIRLAAEMARVGSVELVREASIGECDVGSCYEFVYSDDEIVAEVLKEVG